MVKVSVIIPVYNTEKYLPECIESLINQTLDDIELIFVNDASTDSSRSLLEEYGQKYSQKIKIINLTANIKQGGARNCGIGIASGEYIGFVDSDDYVNLDMFEKMYNEAKSHNYDLVEADWFVEDETKMTKKIFKSSEITGFLDVDMKRELILNATPIVVKIYKRSIIEENTIRFPEKLAYEDIPLIVSTPLFIDSRGKVNEPLYHYIKRPESTTTLKNSLHHYDRLITTNYLLEDLKVRGLYKKFKPEIDFQYIKRAYLVTIMTCLKRHDRINVDYLYKSRKNIKMKLPDFKKNKYMSSLTKYQKTMIFSNEISPYFTIFMYRFLGEIEMMKHRLRN